MTRKHIVSAVLGLCLCSAASAQSDHPVARVAAGLVLAETAVEDENASLLISALEMISAYAPRGEAAARLLEQYQAEARFLARGDPALIARYDKVAGERPAPSQQGMIWILDDGTFEVPDAQEITAFASQSSALADQGRGVACLRDGFEWLCDPPLLQREVTIRPETWVVIQTRPAAQ